jgi:hypothetical protein
MPKPECVSEGFKTRRGVVPPLTFFNRPNESVGEMDVGNPTVFRRVPTVG